MVQDPIGDGLTDPGAAPEQRRREKEAKLSTPLQRYRTAFEEAIELKGFSDGLGVRAEEAGVRMPPNRASAEDVATHKAGLDIAKSIVDETLKASRELATEARTSQREAFESQLGNLKERVERAEPQGGASVIQQFKEISEFLESMADRMSKSLGMGKLPTSAADLPKLVELENLRMEGDDRHKRWEAEMEERRREWAKEDQRWHEEMAEKQHRWEIEDRRWEEEHRQKVAEFQAGQRKEDKVFGELDDIVGAFTKSAEVKEEDAQIRQEAPPQPTPTSFLCKTEGCGATVEAPAGVATGIKCGKCGAFYTVEER